MIVCFLMFLPTHSHGDSMRYSSVSTCYSLKGRFSPVHYSLSDINIAIASNMYKHCVTSTFLLKRDKTPIFQNTIKSIRCSYPFLQRGKSNDSCQRCLKSGNILGRSSPCDRSKYYVKIVAKNDISRDYSHASKI